MKARILKGKSLEKALKRQEKYIQKAIERHQVKILMPKVS